VTVSGRYWIPGPVEIAPEVAGALTLPMIGHHTTAGHALAEALQHALRAVFATTRPVLLATCSATGMMEAAVRAAVGRKLLAVVGGTFGERFATIAERCGKTVVRVAMPPEEPFDVARITRHLPDDSIDALSIVHVETSTGVVAPVAEAIAAVGAAQPRLLTIVDAVASLGGMPVDPEGWDADFVLAAPQKALAAPPGLAFAVASDRFLEGARQSRDAGLYLDVVNLHRSAAEGRFPQTPAINLCQALRVQCERILGSGLEQRHATHRRMRERVEHWVHHASKFALVAPAGARADTVSALRLTAGHGAADVVARLARDGYQVAPGKGDDLDRIIRVGHMGDVTPDQLDHLLATLDERT
jgi:aspartate aminotransferase-like enzyme